MNLTAAEKAAKVREEARQQRIINYAQKQADGFKCGLPDCEEDRSLLVVKLADGTRSTRCARHAARCNVEPFQWNEAQLHPEAEAA